MTTRCWMFSLTAKRPLAASLAPHVPCVVTRTTLAQLGSVKRFATRCTSGGHVAENISVWRRVSACAERAALLDASFPCRARTHPLMRVI